MEKRLVISIDGRKLVRSRDDSETDVTRIYLSNGRRVDVETCWQKDGEIRFKKAGDNKTYSVNKKAVAKIVANGVDHGLDGTMDGFLNEKDNDTTQDMADDLLYGKRAQLIHRIKAYKEELSRQRELLGKLKHQARQMKRKPLADICKEYAWAKSRRCFDAAPKGGACKRASTPQQYKSYVLQAAYEDIRKQQDILGVSRERLGRCEKELGKMQGPHTY